MKDYSMTPKPKNKNSVILMCSFFAVALISLVVTVFISKYRGVVGMITLASLITAILVYTKYVAVTFHYDIVSEGYTEPLFVVRQTVGRKSVTLCRVALADIVKVEKETAAERHAHKTDIKSARYVYTPTLSPDESYRIYVLSRHERAEIIAELDEEFASVLLSSLPEAKAIRALEDEE